MEKLICWIKSSLNVSSVLISLSLTCFNWNLLKDAGEGEDDDENPGGMGKSVDVSQARLDIVAFSKLAAINHQRIRRVAASSWTFRATDFANRIVNIYQNSEFSRKDDICIFR